MLKKLIKKISPGRKDKSQNTASVNKTPIYPSLTKVEKYLRQEFGNTSDLIIRRFVIAGQVPALLVYLDNMVDLKIVNEHIMEPLMEKQHYPVEDIEELVRTVVTVGQVQIFHTMDKVLEDVLYGSTAVFIEQMPLALVADTKGWKFRDIQKPDSEQNVLGPKEAFTETAIINQTILRRRIRSTRLRFEQLTVGEISKTDVFIAYIDGLAKPELIEEVKQRFNQFKIDGVPATNYLIELIDDHPLSPFTTIERTERPDKMTAALLEGRVGIIVDGTPFQLIVPTIFWDFLMTTDDYAGRFYFGSFMRILRILSLIVTLTLPSLYIAITTHHQEMLPTALALSIAGAREGVPFSVFIEALLMDIVFELVREGGVRLPNAVGQAVSIVGALVLGDAAVRAGIVSATVVIVVAGTGLASFVIPGYTASNTIRLLRFPLMLLSWLWGLHGLISGLLIIICHAISLSSFGQPYLWPVAPVKLSGLKDTVIRAPRWAMGKRPNMALDKDRLQLKKSHTNKEENDES